MVVPLLAVEPSGAAPPDVRPDAIAVTSANAAPAAAAAAARSPGAPVFAVGARSAEALRAAGVAEVRSANGAGAALARLVAGTVPPGGTVLHVAGRDRNPEPRRSLEAAGLRVVVHEAYAAAAAPALPDALREALAAGRLDAALHYSRRSAAALVDLALAAGLGDPLGALLHACLSAEVAAGLAPLGSRRIATAERPDEDALLRALDAAAAAPHGAVGTNSAADACRTDERDQPPMSVKSSPDPLKRTPPTVDLKPGEFKAVPPAGGAPATESKTPDAGAEAAGEGATAVEPAATLGLDVGVGGPGPKTAPSGPGAPGAVKATGPSGPAVKVGPASAAAKLDGKPATGPSKAAPSAVPASGPAAPDAAKAGAKPGDPAASARGGEGPAPTAKARIAEPAGAAAGGAAASAAAARSPRRSRGFGSLLAASLVGGVAGAALALGAQRVLDGPDGTADRVAALERRVAAAPAPAAADPDLVRRVAAAEAAARDASAAARAAAEAAGRPPVGAPAAAGVPAPGDGALRTAVDGLGTRLAALEEAAKRADANAAAIADLSTKAEAGAAASADLAGKLDGLRRDLGDRLGATASALEALNGRVAALGTSGDATAANLAAAQAAQGSLQSALQALTGGVGTLQARATETDSRLAALSGDVAKLSPAAVQAGLRVVVAGRLADALRAGAPLGPTLAALERLGAPADALGPLRPYATEPAPAAPALAAEFKPLAASLTAEPPAPATSLGDRFLRIAEKVVTVRAVGDGSGTDLPGLVARAEAALGRGDLPEAARALDALPPDAKTAVAPFAEKLRRRVAADAAAARLSAETVASLDASTR